MAALTRDSKETLIKWLRYIGIKYKGTDVLSVDFHGGSSNRVFSTDGFEEPVICLLSNMTALTEYGMRLQPLSGNIIKAIDDNENIELYRLKIWINAHNAEMQFDNLASLKQKETIRYFHIEDSATRQRENFSYTTVCINLFQQLQYLSALEISTNIGCGHNYTLIINILQKLPQLIILSIQKFIADPIKDSPIDMNAVVKTRIRHITLGMYIARTGNRFLINDILKFALESCPKLTRFTLKGSLMCSYGNIDLNFKDHSRIERVTVDVKRLLFYTFGIMFGPGRTSFTPCIDHGVPLRTPLTDDLRKGRFFINITSNNPIHLDLSKPDLKGV